ncbi:carboxy methyl transferase for protein phosphatase 2A [Ceratocystis pirilliformis]|uniref:Leucine carboxyl methyltransferase 1 n=1 Tax=Ceratocystis pirilliformis TaxID=259994 RepID=A0ABR3ZEM2_9PEZI
MSAPSIPNLLSLRGRGAGASRRGRAGNNIKDPQSTRGSRDAVVQGTDTDAAISRLSAVEVGYLADPFAQYFVGTVRAGAPTRRLPIINRGTYTRTTALDRLVKGFLQSNSSSEKQIISLGAGTDTRSLRLFSQPSSSTGLVYHEIDFPIATAQKLVAVQSHPALQRVFQSTTEVSHEITEGQSVAVKSWSSVPALGGQYFCHGVDLRQLIGTAGRKAMDLTGLRTDIPTLLLSECCLCYLETHEAQAVIAYFTTRINDVGIALYEPIRPDDAFGRMMVWNLAARQISMPTLYEFKTPRDQELRLSQAGFNTVHAETVERLWGRWVTVEEKTRVDGLEGLDEVEEWNLLADHYVIAWGWKGAGFSQWEGSNLAA